MFKIVHKDSKLLNQYMKHGLRLMKLDFDTTIVITISRQEDPKLNFNCPGVMLLTLYKSGCFM